ncbi:MAG: hypothetical protein ACRDQW_09610 [Haloechinothrix sp.]
MSVDGADTVELGRVGMPGSRTERAGGSEGGFWRGLAGSLAAGLLLLAVVLLVAEVLASDLGVQGPGHSAIVGHVVGAVLALAATRFADRSTGTLAALGVAGSALVTFGTLWLFWWS